MHLLINMTIWITITLGYGYLPPPIPIDQLHLVIGRGVVIWTTRSPLPVDLIHRISLTRQEVHNLFGTVDRKINRMWIAGDGRSYFTMIGAAVWEPGRKKFTPSHKAYYVRKKDLVVVWDIREDDARLSASVVHETVHQEVRDALGTQSYETFRKQWMLNEGLAEALEIYSMDPESRNRDQRDLATRIMRRAKNDEARLRDSVNQGYESKDIGLAAAMVMAALEVKSDSAHAILKQIPSALTDTALDVLCKKFEALADNRVLHQWCLRHLDD